RLLPMENSTSKLDQIFSIDHFVSPHQLAAEEIHYYLQSTESVRVESYAYGAAQLRTITVPSRWPKIGKLLSEVGISPDIVIGLIARPQESGSPPQIIFPRGDDWFEAGDEVTIAGTTEAVQKAHTYFGITQRRVQSAFIVGGGLVGEY